MSLAVAAEREPAVRAPAAAPVGATRKVAAPETQVAMVPMAVVQAAIPAAGIRVVAIPVAALVGATPEVAIQAAEIPVVALAEVPVAVLAAAVPEAAQVAAPWLAALSRSFAMSAPALRA